MRHPGEGRLLDLKVPKRTYDILIVRKEAINKTKYGTKRPR